MNLCCCFFSAPLKLQELLKTSNLPNEFLLPFDPRIKVGTILVGLVTAGFFVLENEVRIAHMTCWINKFSESFCCSWTNAKWWPQRRNLCGWSSHQCHRPPPAHPSGLSSKRETTSDRTCWSSRSHRSSATFIFLQNIVSHLTELSWICWPPCLDLGGNGVHLAGTISGP